MLDAHGNFLWLTLCVLASGLLAATLARIGLPAHTPAKWADLARSTQGQLLVIALVGGGFGYLAAQAIIQVDLQLTPTGPQFWLWAGGRWLLRSASWAVVGVLLGQLAYTTDYDELRVMALDFSGAPLIMGGLVGGLAGSRWGGLFWSNLNVILRTLAVVGDSLAGALLGCGLGVLFAVGIRALLVYREQREIPL